MSLPMPRIYAERYAVRELVGEGSFSRTYVATDQVLQRDVALKILRWEYAQDPDYAARFDREARAAARISHSNVIPVYDFGAQSGLPFIVMQFVDGPTLKEYVRDEGPLTTEESLDIARQILDGLAAIHEQHIIHRDVKPQNVLLDGKLAKLTDFGVAALPVEHGLTQTGMTVGTAAYMAPEQASGDSVGPQADLYAVGVILYELLTGQLPFRGDNPVQVMYRHVSEIPRPPRELNPYVPLALEAAVLKALSKAPVSRFADARTMRDALLFPGSGPFVAVQPGVARGSAAATAAAAQTAANARVTQAPVRQSSGRMPRAAAGGVPRQPPRRPTAQRSQPRGWPIFVALLLIVLLSATALGLAAWSGFGLLDDDTPPTATETAQAGTEPTATTGGEGAVPGEVTDPTASPTSQPEPTSAPEATATPAPPEPTATVPPPPPEPTATVPPEPTATPENGDDDDDDDDDDGQSGPPPGEFNQPILLDAVPPEWAEGGSMQFGRDDFVSGGAYMREDGTLYDRPAAHLYSQETEFSLTTLAFQVEGQASSYVAIVMTGMDDERGGKVRSRLTLNEQVIWEGQSPFENEQWTTVGWLVGNLGWLREGDNTLTFEILENNGEFGQPPWILLTEAVLYAN